MTRRKHDEQFKRDAINLLSSSSKTLSQVAADLGIKYDLLSRWRKEPNESGKQPIPGNGNASWLGFVKRSRKSKLREIS